MSAEFINHQIEQIEKPQYERQDRTGFAKLLGFQQNPLQIIADEMGLRFWEYRDLWEKAARFEIETEYPIELNFELNFSCNLSCPMCLWSTDVVAEKPESWFQFEKFSQIINDGVARGLCSVQFNFINEPLIRKDLPKFIAYARSKGVLDLILHTNGTLLTEQMSVALIEAGLTRLNVSIDAFSEESYNQIRVGGNFEKVQRNILQFLDIRTQKVKRLPLLIVSFVRQKDNEHELQKFVDYWQQKADVIAIQEYANFFRISNQETSENRGEDFFSSTAKTVADFQCPQPWQRMAIRYDGSVLPCCSNYGTDLVIGNIKQNTVQELWLSPQMKQLRYLQSNGKIWDNPVCNECAKCTSPIAE